MKRRMMTLVAFLLLALILGSAGAPTAVRAQTSPQHDLSWHVVAAGGLRMASSAHVVHSTVGQLAIGPGVSTHLLGSGYWYGIPRGAGPVGYDVYLPLVFRNWP